MAHHADIDWRHVEAKNDLDLRECIVSKRCKCELINIQKKKSSMLSKSQRTEGWGIGWYATTCAGRRAKGKVGPKQPIYHLTTAL